MVVIEAVMESPFLLSAGESRSEELAARAMPGGVDSGCGGDQRGQESCKATNTDGLQTDASPDRLLSWVRSESSVQQDKCKVQFKESIAAISGRA
jgi:hypothetical protein